MRELPKNANKMCWQTEAVSKLVMNLLDEGNATERIFCSFTTNFGKHERAK